ncbi:hypothetical protein [Streptomyces ossamyceticus]|uniref:hypothetical protein n=1 Tax=Streptomyces ossamyceticus TaxID=249581 RepID=UPI00341568CA
MGASYVVWSITWTQYYLPVHLTGSQVTCYSVVGPDKGQADVYIDGVLDKTVTLSLRPHKVWRGKLAPKDRRKRGDFAGPSHPPP